MTEQAPGPVALEAEKLRRFHIPRPSLFNVLMLVGVIVALYFAIPALKSISWDSVKGEFEHAEWGWIALVLCCYPFVPIAWATALRGAVNAELPVKPTVLVQLACSFLNLVTPNGIGGTALQLDYLRKQDVPVASSATAMFVSTTVASGLQAALFLIAASLTATEVEIGGSTGNTELWGVAIGAALIGLVVAIPRVRHKVVPAVTRAATDIWAVMHSPRKAALLFGGDLLGILIYPALLGFSLLAFGQHLGFAELVVVEVGAGLLASIAPVPGGIGVFGAALVASLTSFGIGSSAAIAAVVVFRGITFVLPPFAGYPTLRWLRHNQYA